jgi:hypothetical protein
MLRKSSFSIFVALTVLASAALSGCGGSGSSSSNVSGAALRTQVAKAIQNGFSSKSQGQSGTKNVREVARPLVGDSVFRPEYNLWATSVEGGVDFFVDEALTEVGGTERTSYVVDGANFTSTYTVTLTKGILAGLKITNSKGMLDGRFVFDSSTDHPTEGKSTFKGFYQDGEGEFTSTYPGADGAARTYITKIHPDGSAEVTYPNDKDFTFALAYKSDSSGTGTVTGDNALLPATIVWDANGTGTVTFADGSTMNFINYQFNDL